MQNLNKNWKVLKSHYLVREPWCTVREDHVRLPNGAEIPNYYVLEYPNWINVIGITKDNKFVMIKQYRHGLALRTYELVAGVCDDTDATPLASAKRELLEETGYSNGNWELLTVTSANPGTHTNLCYCFLATGIEKVADQNLEATEDLDVILLSLEEVQEILLKDQMKQSMHTTPLWKYMAINKLI